MAHKVDIDSGLSQSEFSSDEFDAPNEFNSSSSFNIHSQSTPDIIFTSQPNKRTRCNDIDSGLDNDSVTSSCQSFFEKNRNRLLPTSPILPRKQQNEREIDKNTEFVYPSDDKANQIKQRFCVDDDTEIINYDNGNNVGEQLIIASPEIAFNSNIPRSIYILHQRVKSQYSDHAFVHAIAANMCRHIYPKECHISLKLTLLLSIISCNVRIFIDKSLLFDEK